MPPLNPLVPSFNLPPPKQKASPTMSATSSSASWMTVGSENPALTRSSMTTAGSTTSRSSRAEEKVDPEPGRPGTPANSERSGLMSALGHLEIEDEHDTSHDATPRTIRRVSRIGAEDRANGQVKAPYTGWQSSFPSSFNSSFSQGDREELLLPLSAPRRVSPSNGSISANDHTASFASQQDCNKSTSAGNASFEHDTFPHAVSAVSIKRARSPSMPILPSIELRQSHSDIQAPYTHRFGTSDRYDLSASFNGLDIGTGASFYTPPQHSSSRPSYFETAPAVPASPYEPALVSKGSFFSPKPNSVRFSDEHLGDYLTKDDRNTSSFPAQAGFGDHAAIHHTKSMADFGDVGLYNGFGLYRNVMVNSLPASMDPSSLRAFAEEFGPVHSVAIKQRDQGVGHPQYGFVLFKHPDDAKMFIEALRLQKVSCDFAKEDWATEFKAREDRASANLYIVNLPLDFTDSDLERLLHPARIISHKFLGDHAGNKNGVAMARLESRYQAEQAIYKLNGKVRFDGCGEALAVRVADSPDQKQLKRTSGQQTGNRTKSFEAFDPYARRSSLGGASHTPYSPSHIDLHARQREYHLAELAKLEGGLSSPRTPSHSVIFGRQTAHPIPTPRISNHFGSPNAWRYSRRLPEYTPEYDDEERGIIGPLSPTRQSGWGTPAGIVRANEMPHQPSVGSMRPSLLSHRSTGPASMMAAALSHARSSPDLTTRPQLLFPPTDGNDNRYYADEHGRARSGF